MDVKNAKQAANTTKKGFEASQREISADSGIGSLSCHSSGGGGGSAGDVIDVKKSPQRQRNRPRNLEMVFSGRNKFHVRDLTDDSFSDDNVQPLALPQLPTVYNSKTQPANLRCDLFLFFVWILFFFCFFVLHFTLSCCLSRAEQKLNIHLFYSGLVRATNNQGNRASINSIGGNINKHIELNQRQMSFNSMVSETVEEEKLQRDNSITEKGINRMMVATAYLSKSPSASNSITVSNI